MLYTFILGLIQAEGEMGGATGTEGTQGSPWTTWIFLLAMIAIFYFLMIRPQQKKQKEIKKAREAMKVGDRVITAGGIHGKITSVKDTYFVISVDSNVALKVDKGSVYPNGTAPEDLNENK